MLYILWYNLVRPYQLCWCSFTARSVAPFEKKLRSNVTVVRAVLALRWCVRDPPAPTLTSGDVQTNRRHFKLTRVSAIPIIIIYIYIHPYRNIRGTSGWTHIATMRRRTQYLFKLKRHQQQQRTTEVIMRGITMAEVYDVANWRGMIM